MKADFFRSNYKKILVVLLFLVWIVCPIMIQNNYITHLIFMATIFAVLAASLNIAVDRHEPRKMNPMASTEYTPTAFSPSSHDTLSRPKKFQLRMVEKAKNSRHTATNILPARLPSTVPKAKR